MLLVLYGSHGGGLVKDRMPRLYIFRPCVNFGIAVLDLALSRGFENADKVLFTPQAKEKKPKGRGIALESPQEPINTNPP